MVGPPALQAAMLFRMVFIPWNERCPAMHTATGHTTTHGTKGLHPEPTANLCPNGVQCPNKCHNPEGPDSEVLAPPQKPIFTEPLLFGASAPPPRGSETTVQSSAPLIGGVSPKTRRAPWRRAPRPGGPGGGHPGGGVQPLPVLFGPPGEGDGRGPPSQ